MDKDTDTKARIEGIAADPLLTALRSRLIESAADSLHSVVLYGAAAHGDAYEDCHQFHVLIVLRDMSLTKLATIAEPVSWWLRKKQPMPRIFSPEFLADAADVFPIEILDIVDHHFVLVGEDPFADLKVETKHLRIQCERELREKMLRLREGYLQAWSRPKQLQRLLSESFPAFVQIFRGCLRLGDDDVPLHDSDVVQMFCRQAGVEIRPFEEVLRLKHKQKTTESVQQLFTDYYKQLNAVIRIIDRLDMQKGTSPS